MIFRTLFVTFINSTLNHDPQSDLLFSGYSNKDNIVMEFLIHVHKTLPQRINGLPFMDYIPDMVHSALSGSERPPSVLIEKGYLKAKQSESKHCTPMENVIRQEVEYGFTL